MIQIRKTDVCLLQGNMAQIRPKKRASALLKATRSHNRLSQVLDQAALVFARRGFAAASVREIVQPIGMLPGSLYYHFATKEDLLVAVYQEGVSRISAAVDAAAESITDPWKRLEAACVTHLTCLLDNTDYAQVIIMVRPSDVPRVADDLVALRNGYEQRFNTFIKHLPLDPAVNRHDFRLLLMGGINWAHAWYSGRGRLSPAQIAREFVRLLKNGAFSQKKCRGIR